MRHRIPHIVFSAFLAILVLFGSTAKEYIHEFTGHQDTVHHQHHDGELSFDNEHHHCSFLGDSLQPFHSQHYFPFIEIIAVTHSYIYVDAVYSVKQKELLLATLRGPPVIS